MQKKIISVILILALIIPFIIPNIVFAANESATKDYSDITKLSNEYSYGTLFWTEGENGTKIEKLSDNDSYEDTAENGDYIFYAKPDEHKTISIRVTKCAVDKDGDLCDVICKITDVKSFSEANTRPVSSTDSTPDSKASLTVGKYGNTGLVKFWFNTKSAEGHFSMKYVKSGTETAAKVSKVAASLGDIDVAHDDKTGDTWLGSEGFTLDGVSGEVFYKKGNWLQATDDENISSNISNDYIGVRTPNVSYGHINEKNNDGTDNTNIPSGVHAVVKDNDLDLYNSAVVTEEIGEDATFKLYYSGYGCGILYLFASPYSFGLDNPIKTASQSSVHAGDKFTYTIKQYVPNNYYADQLNFIENSEGKYSSFEITDELNSNLELDGDASSISVKNENNTTVDYFDITVDGNTVKATAKTTALENEAFYAHTYSISIPVKVNNIIDTSVDKITNKATTVAKIGTNDPETKESNNVDVNLKYTVTFDLNGGTTPKPEDQEVLAGEKATNPNYTGEKTGYTFEGWSTTDPDTETASPYDFNTPVNSDITLYAIWKPVENYTITYHLNADDATNNPSNPGTYSTGDSFTFNEPTREGYNFKGWYSDEGLTTPMTGITVTDTGDKNVYAKWEKVEEKENAKYVVEHYKQTLDGNYEKDNDATENLEDEIGKDVTATPKSYTGYKENTSHSDRVATGKISEDGSLVLKLYYDRIEYKVTFDTKGGAPKPDTQTKQYGDKAVKPSDPSQSGYIFNGWYYINEDGKEAQYNFEDPVTHDVDLYAKWKSIPKDDDTTIPAKTDSSVSTRQLPNTGKATILLFALGVCIVVIIGKRYYSLKDITK